jgi:hypothetical protein
MREGMAPPLAPIPVVIETTVGETWGGQREAGE